MDNTPQTTAQQPTNEDQELAAALANVLPGASAPSPTAPAATEAPVDSADQPATTEASADTPSSQPTQTEGAQDSVPVETDSPAIPSIDVSAVNNPVPQSQPAPTPSVVDDLESIKKNALGELRPIIDKVDLPAEEKFDTYLMLIRSTDDKDLIAPAHAVALTIADDKRKAEALLDIIKEIDYLSRADQPTNQ